MWATYGAGYKTVALGFVLLLGGIPVYVWLKWKGVPLQREAAGGIDREG